MATEYFQVRCRPEDKERWQILAASKSLGLGTLVKILLNNEAEKQGESLEINTD